MRRPFPLLLYPSFFCASHCPSNSSEAPHKNQAIHASVYEYVFLFCTFSFLYVQYYGAVIFENNLGHMSCCAKLLLDPNSKISCLYVASFLRWKASEN